jgi:hypothetical protein
MLLNGISHRQNHPQNNGGSGFNQIIASQKNLISTQT